MSLPAGRKMKACLVFHLPKSKKVLSSAAHQTFSTASDNDPKLKLKIITKKINKSVLLMAFKPSKTAWVNVVI